MKSVSLSVIGIVVLLTIGLICFRHIETKRLERAGVPDGQHEYLFSPEHSTKTIGSMVFAVDSIQQSDSVFRPSFQVLRSIRPSDVVRCPDPASAFEAKSVILSKTPDSGRLVDSKMHCVWQEDSPGFEHTFKSFDDQFSHIRDLGIAENNALVLRAAEFGNTTGMLDYLDITIINNFAPEADRYIIGSVPTDPDQAIRYWRVLKTRSSYLHPENVKRLSRITEELGQWFYHEGEHLTDWNSDDNFPTSMEWFTRAAEVGEPDGMLGYLRGCVMQTILDDAPGRVVRYAPTFFPDRELSVQYFNSILEMEKAGLLKNAWQQKILGVVRSSWKDYTNSNGASQPASPIKNENSSNTDSNAQGDESSGEVTVVSTEQEYYSSSLRSPQLLLRNDGSHAIYGVIVHVTGVDPSGVVQDVGDAMLDSIPAHTTARTTCCLNNVGTDIVLKVGTPTFRR